MSEPILRAIGLEKRYPIGRSGSLGLRSGPEIDAVRGVDLHIDAGETVALVGESGSGKSTTGRLLLGLEAPSAGSVLYHGRDLREFDRDGWRRFRRGVQVVFQDPFGSLNPRQTVRSMLGEALTVHGVVESPAVPARIERLLSLVGLDVTAADRYPHQFSGGQRQRLGIARALSVEPELIVADEPVSALDVSVRAQVLNLLLDLQHELDLAVLFIAHDLALVRHVADRTAVMAEGRIVEQGPTGEIFALPGHDRTRELLAAILPPPGQSP